MLLRTVTDEIMQAIAKLSGQEYVDVDARRAKAELAAARPRRARPATQTRARPTSRTIAAPSDLSRS